jgi:hypothetical protein
MIMATFVERVDLSGKNIHPFVTYAVSGMGDTIEDYTHTDTTSSRTVSSCRRCGRTWGFCRAVRADVAVAQSAQSPHRVDVADGCAQDGFDQTGNGVYVLLRQGGKQVEYDFLPRSGHRAFGRSSRSRRN